jgi:hypothetical protein
MSYLVFAFGFDPIWSAAFGVQKKNILKLPIQEQETF